MLFRTRLSRKDEPVSGFLVQIRYWTIAAAVVLALAGANKAGAELKPSEVAVLANSSFSGSVGLAKYYCQVRGIPQSHIISLAMPDGEQIGRLLYEKSIAVQFREKMALMPDGENIRCVVTVYGVPLRIGPAGPSRSEKVLLARLAKDANPAADELENLLARAKQEVGLRDTQAMGDKNELLEKRIKRLGDLIPGQMKLIRQKIATIPESVYKTTIAEKIDQIEIGILGTLARIEQLQRQGADELSESPNERLTQLQNEVRESGTRIRKLAVNIRTLEQLEEVAQLTRQNYGALGLVYQLDAISKMIRSPYENSSSSFDSELSMVLAGEYPLGNWVPNYLSLEFSKQFERQSPRVLMVCRIDGANQSTAKRLIDMAVRTEHKGLAGRAYIDAGWERAGKKGYKNTEESLLATAKLLQQHSGMSVKFDTVPTVFAAGACPQAALYCGWYELRNYVDAFNWVEGAVGYHIASFEMETLRDPKFTGWASSMVRDGITATLGAVEEPYLGSFPPPDKFFALLLTGKYSLAECYYLTKRFNSWRLVLIGDPLYRPFGRNPRMSLAQAEQILKCKLTP